MDGSKWSVGAGLVGTLGRVLRLVGWPMFWPAIALSLASGVAAGEPQKSDHSSHDRTTTIFRCVRGNQVIYSDSACASDNSMTRVKLPPINYYHSDEPSKTHLYKLKSPQSTKPSRRREARQNDSIAAEQRRAKERCNHIGVQLETIADRMRAGYTAKQGERLRQRQRDLERKRHEYNCHGY